MLISISPARAGDIRAGVAISGYSLSKVPYIATLSDCDNVARVEVPGGSSVAIVREGLGSDGDCNVRFQASGTDRLNPSLEVHYLDGSSKLLQESFPAEDMESPVVSLDSISIEERGGQQRGCSKFCVSQAASQADVFLQAVREVDRQL